MSRSSVNMEGVAPSARGGCGALVASDLGRFGIIGRNASRPSGLSLRMSAPDVFRIGVRAEDGRLLMELGPFSDTEIVGAWRTLSAESGLPFVVATETEAPTPVGSAAPVLSTERRKRLAVLAARRPRFLTRRRTGSLPLHPRIHRAHEIARGTDR